MGTKVTEKPRKPLKVFCSYSHRDEHYLESLKTWLVGLERDGLIEQWHDRMISAGGEWEEAIAEHLETSDLILLLITPDFMASQYIYEEEISRAVEKHHRGEARVIPVMVRPSPPLRGTPFGKLQALPKDSKPITTWPNQDEAWLDVLTGIQQAVAEISFNRQPPDQDNSSEQIYREAVEWAWTDGELHAREVERLNDLAGEYELSTDSTSALEREVMGDTKEAILERQEQVAREKQRRERYRRAVEAAWTDHELSDAKVEQLSTLASDLGLSNDAAADIERVALGDTVRAILQQQTRELDERERYLAGLYDRARELHGKQQWQAVVEVFEQISSEESTYPDSEGLLQSAIDALQLRQRVTALTTEVPDLTGQEVPQASSALVSKNLELGSQREAPSDNVPEGRIIEQSPEAGGDVPAGRVVNVTVSSGPTTVSVPNLIGKSHPEARSTLEAAGLELGSMTLAPSEDMPEDRVVQQSPMKGDRVARGSSVRVTLSSGPQTVGEQTQPGPTLIDGLARVCAKYAGPYYYLEEAITEEKLFNARLSFQIPSTERVVALLDVTEDGSSKFGLAICEEGIRWCNERTSSGGLIYRRWHSTQRGFLLWSEFADAHIEKHSGHNVLPIEIGESNIFFMTRTAMDPDDLIRLLSDLQSFLKAFA